MPKTQNKKVVEESSEEEEEIVTTKKQQKNNAGAAKPVAKKPAKVESESEEEEEVQPAKTGKIAQKVAAKKGSAKKVESDDEEEEEVKPVATKSASAKSEEGGKGVNHPHEVIVKGLPFSAGEQDLTEFFQECGTVDGANVLKGQDGRSKGMAFVRFSTEDALKAALAYNGSDFGGRKVTIEKTVPKEQRAAAGGAPREFQKSERDPTSSSIFVGNLSYQTTEDSLWSFFESCGQISNVRVAMDQDGRPRGFAHVDFASPDSVESAVQKAGSQLDGRPVRVDYSTPKKNDGQRGGFGGGNRQGGYGGGNRQGGYGGGRQRGGRY